MNVRRVVLLSVVALFAVLAIGVASAAALEPAGHGWFWQSPAPQGRTLNDVTMVGTSAWAVGDGGAILYSADAGVTWSTQTAPTSEPLGAVDFADARHGWAVGGLGWDGVYSGSSLRPVLVRTDDGGATWVKVPRIGRRLLSDVDFADAQRGWMVGRRGVILHSADGGTTWSHQDSGTFRSLNSVFFADARHGWAAGNLGTLLRTRDGGHTWTRVRVRGEAAWCNLGSLAVAGDGTLWVTTGQRNESGEFPRLASSRDGGVHWRFADVGETFNVWRVIAPGSSVYAVGPADDISGTSRVLVSHDGGETWTQHVLGANVSLGSLAISPFGPLCAVGECLATSDDHGASWTTRSLKPPAAGNFAFAGAGDVWTTGASGFWLANLYSLESWMPRGGSVLHASDGATWREQLSDSRHRYFDVGFAGVADGWAVGTGGAIRHTSDGGATWKAQDSGTHDDLLQVEAPSAADAWVLAVATTWRSLATRLLHTTDGGASWTPVDLPDGYLPVVERFTSPTNGWVLGYTDRSSVVMHTTDGGVTWTDSTPALSSRSSLTDLDFVDKDHGWLLGYEQLGPRTTASFLLATTDGGRHWTNLLAGDSLASLGFMGVDFADARHGWMTNGDVYATSDGGATWRKKLTGLGYDTVSGADATHAYIGGIDLGILSTVDATGDIAPPATLSEGVRGWLNYDTQFSLTAGDSGSAVAKTEYRVDSGSWQDYAGPIDFPAPADHSGDGRHMVEYRSVDTTGNVEPVQRARVNIDTVQPVITLQPSGIGRDGVTRIYGRIDDASCSSVSEFWYTVERADGSVVLTSGYSGFSWPTNRDYMFRESGFT